MKKGDFQKFLKFACKRSTRIRALKVACVVTPVLTILNHAHDMMALNLGTRFFFQMVLTFCVPYLVSTYSSAMTELKNAEAHGEPIS